MKRALGKIILIAYFDRIWRRRATYCIKTATEKKLSNRHVKLDKYDCPITAEEK